MSEEKVHPAVKARAERIQRLLEFLKDNPKTPLRKIIAEFSFETGLSVRKINEYLKILSMMGKIRIYPVNDFKSKDYGEEYVEIQE